MTDDLTAPIVNRVAQSAIETIDLAAIIGSVEVVALDLAPLLHRGLLVREVDFRASVKALDVNGYAGCHVAVLVPEGALVPAWAPMLVAATIAPVAASVGVATTEARLGALAAERLGAYDWSVYAGKPVVLKGCGTGAVPLDAFAQATIALQGVASKVMFGEPCSAVPVWRRPAAAADARPAARASIPSAARPTRP